MPKKVQGFLYVLLLCNVSAGWRG
ncbi:RepA leader peptide Tap [Yersinia enterocolitica]